ncbi:hypothetical protein I317_01694 [Kwoniella heveanensis CBS 569]|nr:hypothetical protein I317_01694 [Kwoniella heveanensis CBS 569]
MVVLSQRPAFTPLLVSLALLHQTLVVADPFFVVQHGASIITSRLDPIISPGGVSAHVHSIVGTSSFRPDYTYENSCAGRCTSANVDVDKSSYWTPQLYRKKDSGGVELVKMNRVNTYYFIRRTGPTEPINEFPPGFKMLAGYPFRSTFDANDPTNAAIAYTCLGAPGQPNTNGFPTTSCPSDLRAEVTFPNCWDGTNVWLEGSKHVAYPAEGRFDSGGRCPSTHPHRLPTLFYEFHYYDQYPYEPGRRVWAMGDDLGYGFHGDFTNGWPEGLFTDIVAAGESCAVLFELGSCPPLAPHFTGNGTQTCAPDYPDVVVNEEIGLNGPVAALPGTNPLWGSTGPAPAQDAPVVPVAGAGGGGGGGGGGAESSGVQPASDPAASAPSPAASSAAYAPPVGAAVATPSSSAAAAYSPAVPAGSSALVPAYSPSPQPPASSPLHRQRRRVRSTGTGVDGEASEGLREYRSSS